MIITNLETFEEALAYISDKSREFVAFDLETNGLEELKHHVIGIAFTADTDGGFYLPISEWNIETNKLEPIFEPDEIQGMVTRLWEVLIDKKLIMHNGVFDISMMHSNFGLDLTDSLYADTMLLKHTIAEEHPFGLKEIGELLWGTGAVEEQMELKEEVKTRGGSWNQKNKDMYMASLNTLAKYAIKDVILTLKVFDELSDILHGENLEEFFYEQEVMPLYREVTIPMRVGGLPVNVEYFQQLKTQTEQEIEQLNEEFFDLVKEDIKPKVREILDKEISASKIGQFAEKLFEYYNLEVPINKKTGKPTFNKTAIKKLEKEYPEHPVLKWFISDNVELDEEVVYEIKKRVYVARNPDHPNVFNHHSTFHLGWLLYDCHGQEPKKRSKKTNAPQVDKDSLEEYDLHFIPTLATIKKKEKLLNTYIDPILEKQVDGWVLPNMLQHGTTSGRYSCRGGMNWMTLPRDQLSIKQGIQAPSGYKLIGTDYSALEARIFSHVSGDPGLIDVWKRGDDLYSQIAIDIFGLHEYSANPNDNNYLKDKAPEWRNKSKTIALAIPYGSGPGRVASILKVPYEEAQDIVNSYLNAYPRLKDYMAMAEEDAIFSGFVSTDFGRIRHLDEAQELYQKYGAALRSKKRLIKMLGEQEANLLFYRFKNLLNNAKNFKIQSTAAHLINVAMIEISREFVNQEIQGHICLMVHDEIITLVKDEDVERACQIIQDCMENNWIAKELSVPMEAKPIVGNTLAECK